MSDKKIQISLGLKIDLSFSGKDISVKELHERVIASLNEHMPSVLFDDDDADCQAFTDSWEFEIL